MSTSRLDSLKTPPTRSGGATTMTAIVQDGYGPAPEDVLRIADIDIPTVGDGKVLVRVHAASVDRGTWHIMAGLPYPIRLAGFGLRRPKYANPGRSLAEQGHRTPLHGDSRLGTTCPKNRASSFFGGV
jgi:hypothetical protein